jgi:hypothetical protein
MNNKISVRKKTKRHIKKQPSQTLVGVDHKPHKNQLKNKMIKQKMNDKSQANNVNFISKGNEKITNGKNHHRKFQHMIMG